MVNSDVTSKSTPASHVSGETGMACQGKGSAGSTTGPGVPPTTLAVIHSTQDEGTTTGHNGRFSDTTKPVLS